MDLTIQWPNIDSIKEAPSTDDAWTSNIDNLDITISSDSFTPFTCTVIGYNYLCILNWTRGMPRA
ncbi:44691_t:CDS:2, partial [Gigaspora margarita]